MDINKRNSFTQAIMLLFSIIFFVIGILLLFSVNNLSSYKLIGHSADITKVIQQFLGSAYVLIGLIIYSVKDLRGSPIIMTLTSINIIGFIHLYLLFTFQSLMILPTIYFTFQILMQLVIFLALLEQVKTKR